jgi:hypothetical protein
MNKQLSRITSVVVRGDDCPDLWALDNPLLQCQSNCKTKYQISPSLFEILPSKDLVLSCTVDFDLD